MEQQYEIIEVWYPYNGGGEMREISYNGQQEMSPCTKDSELVAMVKE
ncbi:MAG: hypothetical protein ABIH79_02170 [archaeon]